MERANHHRKDEPWTLSAFIRTAIREKIAKMERSRTSGKRKKNDQGGVSKGDIT